MRIRQTTRLTVVVAAALCLAAGCTHDRPLNIDLTESVRVPDPPAIIFFADGLDYGVFRDELSQGTLPNIKKYLVDRGVTVDRAVSCIPSITYAVMTSFLTGLYPGHHGIVGNRWFDRAAGVYRDYSFIKTYRTVGRDYEAPNIFELLGPNRRTVSIQLPNRRGVTRRIDNWATSGINWFFGGYQAVDKLVAMRFELIAAEADKWGPWPDLIFAYFPATDEIGHRYGPNSRQYRAAVRNLDAQIGRICAGLERAGLLERTVLALISDHGMVPAGKVQRIGPILRRRCKPPLSKVVAQVAGPELAGPAWRRRFGDADAVVLTGGKRRASIHLRCPDEPWQTAGPRPERIALAADVCRRANLAELPSVALLAARAGADRVIIANRHGQAEVLRDRGREPYRFRYRPARGDPLGYRAYPRALVLEGTWHSGPQWLAATAHTQFPDLVPQIISLFDSPRCGDVVLFAAPGWGFAPGNRGGHGSVTAPDMRVPMVFAGPGIAKKGSIKYARDVDVMPTILDLMGLGRNLRKCGRLDGRSLRQELVPAEPER